MTSITLFIMLDACGPDYIRPETTPFLYRMGLEGSITPLIPPFGFEPDAAYLAGLYPDGALQGAQFWYDPEKSPFRRMYPQALAPLMDNLPGLAKKVIRKIFAVLARKGCPSPHLSAAQIPFFLLRSFALPVIQNLDHQGFCPSATIFDLLRNSELSYLFHGALENVVTLDAALDRAVKDLHPPLAFFFFSYRYPGSGRACLWPGQP